MTTLSDQEILFILLKKDLQRCREGSISTDELGTTAKRSYDLILLARSIRKLRPHSLIKMLIDFLGDNGTMTEQQYNEELVKLNRVRISVGKRPLKTPFRRGHCGAVMSLRPRKNSWMASDQLQFGSIIDYGENPDGSIKMSMLWREAYQIS